MTSGYDSSFLTQYSQLMTATQQQMHAPLKPNSSEEEKQQPSLPPHLAFTLSSSSGTSNLYPSPPSSAHSLSQLSQSAPDSLQLSQYSPSAASASSSSLLLPHLTSLASSFAAHQQHVNATLQALQTAVADERREREAEAKRSRRDEVSFRRRLQDRLDELRDDHNERLNQLAQEQTNLSRSTQPAPAPVPYTTAGHAPQQPAVSPAALDSLSRDLDSLRLQIHAIRTDLSALTARTAQPSADVAALQQRVESLESLTALHTATIQQQSDHYTAYRTQEVREKEEQRRLVEQSNRRDREEREEKERGMRSEFEAEIRRLIERLDRRDAQDRSRELSAAEQVAAAAADSRKQHERDEQQARDTAEKRRREEAQRSAAAEERERQKRLQAEAAAEAEMQALRREREEIDKQEELARQEKVRQQEADRQRLAQEQQKREQERTLEQERLRVAEEQTRQKQREEAEQKREQEAKLAEGRARAEAEQKQAEQQRAAPLAQAVAASDAAAAPTTTSSPYNLFIRLWNLPLSNAGNNNPIAALFLPSKDDTTATATSSSAEPTSAVSAGGDGWQYCSQTEWMKDERHPVFEQALLWDHDGGAQQVKVSVYDVVDENVRDEDRLGSAVIPVHLLLAAAASAAPAFARPAGSPVPPEDAPVNGLTFRLVHEEAAKQSRLGDVILMVECEADQPASPPPQSSEPGGADVLLVRLSTVALPSRPSGVLASPIAAVFLESAEGTGELAYVDQTEWLRRVPGGDAWFEQAMELEVARGEQDGARKVRLSVYDVDSEEVRDEDRLGHVLLTVGELRQLAVDGVGRELALAHEDGVKERRLKMSGSRVKLSVKLLEEDESEAQSDDELEFGVEEHKAGSSAAPPQKTGKEEEQDEESPVELEVEDEAEEEADQEESSDEEEPQLKGADEEVFAVEKQEPLTKAASASEDEDEDDVELVVGAAAAQHDNVTHNQQRHSDAAVEPTSSAAAHTSAESHSSTPLPATDSERRKEHALHIGDARGESVEKDEPKETKEEEEVEEQYSDFAESSSEEEEDDEDEPQLQHDKQTVDNRPAIAKRELPLMPKLATELSDVEDDSEPSPNIKHEVKRAEALITAVKAESAPPATVQQPAVDAVVSKADESSSDSGSEIEEDIDVEFGADEDHFDL